LAAGDVERHDDAVARGDVGDLGADLLDDPHGLVAEDVARVQVGAEHLVQVQIRPTDGGRRDPHDRVGRFLDDRIRYLPDLDLPLALPCQSPHRTPLSWL